MTAWCILLITPLICQISLHASDQLYINAFPQCCDVVCLVWSRMWCHHGCSCWPLRCLVLSMVRLSLYKVLSVHFYVACPKVCCIAVCMMFSNIRVHTSLTTQTWTTQIRDITLDLWWLWRRADVTEVLTSVYMYCCTRILRYKHRQFSWGLLKRRAHFIAVLTFVIGRVNVFLDIYRRRSWSVWQVRLLDTPGWRADADVWLCVPTTALYNYTRF